MDTQPELGLIPAEKPQHWIMGVTRRSLGEASDLGYFVATLVIETTLSPLEFPVVATAALQDYRPELFHDCYTFSVRYTFELAGLPNDVKGSPPEWESGHLKIWDIYPVKRSLA